MSLKRHISDTAEGTWYLTWFWILIAVLCIVTALGFTTAKLGLLPTWMKMERKAFTESQQYVESAKTAITGYCEEYRAAEKEMREYEASLAMIDQSSEEGQKKAATIRELITGCEGHMKSIKSQIRDKANKLDVSDVPQEARSIIGG